MNDKYVSSEYRVKLLGRIENLTKKSGYCWLYQSKIWRDGYCRIKISNKGKVQRRVVHKVYWELLNGLVPKSMTLDHLCRVRNCINPDHLEIVTQRVNTIRGISPAALNYRKTHCKRGHRFNNKNTYFLQGKHRICRECCKRRTAEYRIRQRLRKITQKSLDIGNHKI